MNTFKKVLTDFKCGLTLFLHMELHKNEQIFYVFIFIIQPLKHLLIKYKQENY